MHPDAHGLVEQLMAGTLSRRQFVVRAAGLGLSLPTIAAFLAACGSSASTPPPASGPGVPPVPPTTAATSAPPATIAVPTIQSIATAAPMTASTVAPAGGTMGTTAASPMASGGMPVNGGELKVASSTEGVTLHPYKFTDTPSGNYIDLLHKLPLIDYDKDTLELRPFAAASVDKSADGTTLTFKLRDNLQWSDGTPLTATDYAWTWSHSSDKANMWPNLGSYTPYIDSVRDIDAKTLEVKLKGVLAISLEKVKNALQYVLPKKVWEPLDWNDPNKNPQIFKPTVVAGPYTLVEWKKDQYATFAANDKFFLGRPHIDRITYRIYGDTNVAAQALGKGEVDQYGPEPENWPDLAKNPKVNAYPYDAANLAVTYIGLNNRLDILKDVKVRQALNYALDKDAIVNRLTYGLGRRATTMYLPTSWAYDETVNPYKQDVAKAKQLLDDAGWKPGANGIRENNGQPLKLLFLFGPNTTPVREQIATVAQQQWKAVGVDVEVRGLEFGALLKATREGPYDWGAYVNAYIANVDPDLIWFKRDAGPAYNRVDYQNPRVFDLYEQGLKELDRGKRATIYKEIDRILTDEAPWIWLYYEQGHQVINKRVQGVKPSKALGLNDVWEWWITPGQ